MQVIALKTVSVEAIPLPSKGTVDLPCTSTTMTCPYCHQPRPDAIYASNLPFTQIKPPLSANLFVPQHPRHGNEPLASACLPLEDHEMLPTFAEGSEDEVEYISKETRRLDALISQLSEKRATLRRRLNHLQSSTCTLSPEVLAVIFKHLCLGQHPEYTKAKECPQLVLGAVSSLWRQVVWSTPILWTSAAFGLRPSITGGKAASLRLFLENSGSLPLSLKLRFPYDTDHDALVHPTIDESLIMNLPRVQELHLDCPPEKWYYFTHHLSQLTTFALHGSTGGDNSALCHGLLLQNSPLLQRLSLRSVSEDRDDLSPLPGIDPPFAHKITILDLDMVSSYICVELLTRCSNLIECSIRSPDRSNIEVRLSEIVLPCLETFLWKGPSADFLPCIHPPSLQTLHLKTNDSDGARIFLTHLPPTLSVLELEWDGFSLPNFVHEDSGVEHLILVDWHPETILDLLLELRSYDRRKDKTLPKLEKLTLRMDPLEWENDYQYLHSDASDISLEIMYTLRKRVTEVDSDQFYLMLDCIQMEWSDQARKILKELVDDGFKVEIHQQEERHSGWKFLDLV